MLTNYKTIRQSIKRLIDLETESQDGTFDLLSKKEALLRTRMMNKLESSLGGIKEMGGLPDAILLSMYSTSTSRSRKRISWGSQCSALSIRITTRSRSFRQRRRNSRDPALCDSVRMQLPKVKPWPRM